jgi:hypothetical protein
MSDWISVKDKLPKHMQHVLALHKDGAMYVLRFTITKEVNNLLEKHGFNPKKNPSEHPYDFSSQEIDGMCLANVTHWMPLPKGTE